MELNRDCEGKTRVEKLRCGENNFENSLNMPFSVNHSFYAWTWFLDVNGVFCCLNEVGNGFIAGEIIWKFGGVFKINSWKKYDIYQKNFLWINVHKISRENFPNGLM